jgi:hypothetical protein
MTPKKNRKKLALDRVTIARLGDADLQQVGGYSPTSTYTANSDYCSKPLAGCSMSCQSCACTFSKPLLE